MNFPITLDEAYRIAHILELHGDTEMADKVNGALEDYTDPRRVAYVKAATQLYNQDGELEVDEDASVSVSSDPGAYVQAWVWVRDEEAGVERKEEDSGDI